MGAPRAKAPASVAASGRGAAGRGIGLKPPPSIAACTSATKMKGGRKGGKNNAAKGSADIDQKSSKGADASSVLKRGRSIESHDVIDDTTTTASPAKKKQKIIVRLGETFSCDRCNASSVDTIF